MKIILHGINHKRNIRMRCDICKCIYEIESWEDWVGRWEISPDRSVVSYSYACECPECGCSVYIGHNPNEGLSNLCSPYDFMFKRGDWEEKYSIKNSPDYEKRYEILELNKNKKKGK